MFASLPATQTGLATENRYANANRWGEHYQEFAYGAISTGIAIIYFDRTGLTPDAAAPPYDDLEHWRQGATFVDIDNDGWLDLYVCHLNAPNLLFFNQHDGTFKKQADARGLGLHRRLRHGRLRPTSSRGVPRGRPHQPSGAGTPRP